LSDLAVASVISVLRHHHGPHRLVTAIHGPTPIVWTQRLGHLLQRVGAADKTGPLQEHVRTHAQAATPLAPGTAFRTKPRDAVWKVYVNTTVEADL